MGLVVYKAERSAMCINGEEKRVGKEKKLPLGQDKTISYVRVDDRFLVHIHVQLTLLSKQIVF